jgi:hypothetical protein
MGDIRIDTGRHFVDAIQFYPEIVDIPVKLRMNATKMRELITGNVPGKIREQQQLKNVDARNISIQKQIDNGERKKRNQK